MSPSESSSSPVRSIGCALDGTNAPPVATDVFPNIIGSGTAAVPKKIGVA
jgi:hypothetical protein